MALADIQLALREVSASLSAAFRGLRLSVTGWCRWLKTSITAQGKICLNYMRDTAHAHYHGWGQYTFPLEHAPPKTIEELGYLGQFILFAIPPIVPIARLLSISFVPLIGNSLQSFKKSDCRLFLDGIWK